jgi:hypothetical protein
MPSGRGRPTPVYVAYVTINSLHAFSDSLTLARVSEVLAKIEWSWGVVVDIFGFAPS